MLKPAKTSKTSIPDAIKTDLETKAATLIENVLKPKHVVPQKPDIDFNYVSDIGTKWYRNNFYVFATYTCPGPNALSPSFESIAMRPVRSVCPVESIVSNELLCDSSLKTICKRVFRS